MPTPPSIELAFARADLPRLRGCVVDCGRAGGLDPDRRYDLVLAVSEAASNAVEHGAGHGILRVWTPPGTVVCEVRDAGAVNGERRHLPGRGRTGQRGRGLLLIRRLCDQVHVFRDADGSGVRMTMLRG